jgi:hypothetical protein
MSDATLLRISNPRAFLIPEIQGFILKSLATSPIMPDAEAALLELVNYIQLQIMGLFLVREGGKYTGLVIAENNPSALSPGCTVLHFYNEGSANTRKALIQAVIDFAEAGGFTKIRGIDINQRPEAFARLFRAAGPVKAIGGFYEFQGAT